MKRTILAILAALAVAVPTIGPATVADAATKTRPIVKCSVTYRKGERPRKAVCRVIMMLTADLPATGIPRPDDDTGQRRIDPPPAYRS